MSHKTTRTAITAKPKVPSPKPAESLSSKSRTPSECGVLDLELLAKKERDLHELIEGDLLELFESLDSYGNGFLTRADVKCAFQTFDIEIDEDEAQCIMDVFDTSGEGHINFPEFRQEMHPVLMGGTLEEHIKLVFKAIDQDGDGYFGFQEIWRQFQKQGAKCEPDEALEAFREISGGSELVDFELFKAYCDDLDRAQKLAQTPITAITKEERKSSRKLSMMQGRKLSMTSSLASQQMQAMKSGLEKIEAAPLIEEDYDDYSGPGFGFGFGFGGGGHRGSGEEMGDSQPSTAAKRPMGMNLFQMAMTKH